MKPNSDISHAEIWDDSALIESWNSAFEEYQKYHSIKAGKCKTLDKVNNVTEESSVPSNKDTTSSRDEDALGSVSSSLTQQDVKEVAVSGDNQKIDSNESITVNDQKSSPNLPLNFIAQVPDEKLKNLMMSWYYAGYYTGLYEGQQHANAAS